MHTHRLEKMFYKTAVFLMAMHLCQQAYSKRSALFAVSLDGGVNVAKEIAEHFGLHYVGQVLPGLDYYHFKISTRRQWVFSTSMFLDKRVKQVFPQTRKMRVCKNNMAGSWPQITEALNKSTILWDTFAAQNSRPQKIKFNDPYLRNQWYLEDKWLNVFRAWSEGFTGKGITASVLDDGLYYLNKDLRSNYEPGISYDISNLENKDDDPTPDLLKPKYNSHGTFCAAILSAAANNHYCGVGVAYNSKIGGVRLLNGKHSMVIDLQEALALSVGSRFPTDIVVSSWGPPDNGKTIDRPGPLAEKALENGIHLGRKGKGAIFVWAVGNGGIKDNCNLDGYASSIYTISVNAVTKSGFSSLYDEPCSASLASVYVGGKHKRHEKVAHNENMVVPKLDGECITTFEGTSAAAPLTAGIIALMLQANNNLTWRDVQNIIVWSGRKPADSTSWNTNGAGLPYHHFFGFGVIDAFKAVQLASTWKSVPTHQNFTISVHHHGTSRNLEPGVQSVFRENVELPKRTSSNATFKMEQVQLNLTLQHSERGKLEIFMESPSGTKSQLLTQRPLDTEVTGFNSWSFVSVHFWDENPNGIWKLSIHTNSNKSGSLKDASITFYGAFYT